MKHRQLLEGGSIIGLAGKRKNFLGKFLLKIYELLKICFKKKTGVGEPGPGVFGAAELEKEDKED